MNSFIGKLLYTSARLFNRSRSVFYSKINDSFSSLDTNTYKSYNKNRPFGPLPKICYAPWTNLFFNTDGKAIICCKNTKVVIGQYPDQTISEIWFNSKVNKLREKIDHKDFSFGCYKCLDSIQQKNANSVTAIQFDKFGMLPLSKYPRIIEFELSNRCNLACVMCSERVSSTIAKQKGELQHSEIKYNDDFVDQLDEFIPHLYEAKFSGGEPFLIPIYYKIWKKIKQIKPSTKIFIQTNGTILNDEIKQLILDLSFRINVSLDSLNKENYEKIRINASFNETMKNIEWFGKHAHHFEIVATPFIDNWKDIPDIVRFCNKNNYHFNFSPVFHPKELSLWALDEFSLNEIVKHYQSINLPSSNWIEKENKKTFQELINSVSDWKNKKNQNSEFEEMFTNYIINQETDFSNEERVTLNLQKISQIKIEYQSNLELNGFTSQEIQKFDEKIKHICTENNFNIPSDSIYLKLKDIEPNKLVISYRSLTDDEIQNKISTLFKEINNEYTIHE